MDQNLSKLLGRHRRGIVDTWARRLQASIPDYRNRPLAELRKTTGSHLSGVIEVLKTGSYEPLERFMAEIAPFRISLKFSLSNTQRAFLIGKEIITNLIEKEFKDQPDRLFQAMREIEEPFNRTLFQYSDIYQNLQIKEAEKRSRALAKAEAQRKFLHKLQEEKRKLEGIVSAIGAGIAVFDKSMKIVWSNKFIADELGSSRMVIGRSCSDLYWHDGEGCQNCPTRRSFRSGNIERSIEETVNSAGQYRFFQIISTPIKDEQGQVSQVLELVQDITDIKRLQEKVDTQQELLSAITNDSADAIIGLDPDDNIISWNKGAEKIFGYSRNEILSKPFGILMPVDLRENGELKLISEEIKEKGFVKNYETVRLAKDGRRVHVDLTRTGIRDKEGRIIGSSAVIRDVTERKRLEQQIIQTERLATVGRMAAKVAHEIRNPLSSISLNTELLGDEIKSFNGGSTGEAESLLASIASEVDRLAQLTEEYLHFSRLPTPKPSPSDVNKILANLIGFLERELIGKRIEVTCNFAKNLPEILLDKDQMQRAFLNLLRNAIEAMPDGGRIDISTGKQDNQLLVHIRDTGVGIAEEHLPKIFDPFHSTKDFGTGLGLSITQQIVKEHQGMIWCSSKVGAGSTFTVQIPLTMENGSMPS